MLVNNRNIVDFPYRRAPSSSTTCSGTPTGQKLTWDVEGRLASWQNTTTNPTVTAKYLYDGEGNRVVQQVVDSTAGTTTTTSYMGSLETYSITTSSGPTNITTTDYIPAGKVLAEAVNGTLSYLATSYQGSVVEALDSTGTVGVTASQLYAPYGGVRYSNGSLPTDYGYTGQRADASTGLDYYGARYYDPTLGQFASADTLAAGGLNRYGYVGGNPTTATDPSGHMLWTEKDFGGGGVAAALALFALAPAAGGGVRTLPNGIPIPGPASPPREPDEMERANARAGVYIGFERWNQVSANRYKAANPPKTTPPGPPPGPGSKPPQTQTGGGGAGAPPSGGQPPVAGPVHPEDDNGCGCSSLGGNIWRHYTSEAGYEGILSSERINVSDASTDPLHARHGTGVYVTNLLAEEFRIGQAAKLFWNLPFYTKRLTHYVDIDTTGLDVLETGKPYIYRIVADPPYLDVSGRIVGGGEAQWKC